MVGFLSFFSTQGDLVTWSARRGERIRAMRILDSQVEEERPGVDGHNLCGRLVGDLGCQKGWRGGWYTHDGRL